MAGIIASRDYNPGDVIYTESAFAKIVRHEFKDILCEFCCERSSGLRACTACSAVKYCGKDCQKNDWSSHKLECKHLKKLPQGSYGDLVRLLGKVILKLKGEDWKRIKCKVLGKEFSFDDIDFHHKEMTENPRMILFFDEVIERTGKYIGFENLPDGDIFMKIVGKVIFSLKNASGITGYFIGAANFTSECISNSNESCVGNVIKIWASKKIRKGKDKIIVPAQEILFLESQFDKLDPLSCKCTDCSLPFGESILFKIIDRRRAYMLIIETESFLNDADACSKISMFSEYQQKADRLLSEQEGVLGDTNYLRMRLLYLICFKTEGNPIYKKKLLLKLERSMRSVFGEYYTEMLPIYESLHSINVQLGDIAAAIKYKKKSNKSCPGMTILRTREPLMELFLNSVIGNVYETACISVMKMKTGTENK